MSTKKDFSTEDYYATDLFNNWKAIINEAEYSVKIFTPYLDSTINKLIKDVNDFVEITIITSIEEENIFQRGFQISALIEAISNGAQVKSLPNLHAKVLVIDNNFISLGSQNFTNRGRTNKEAGHISSLSFEGSSFLLKIEEWELESYEVTIELLEELSIFITKNKTELEKIKNKLEGGVNKIISEFMQKEFENSIIRSRYYNTTFRLPQGEVMLTKTVPYPSYDYFSFFAPENNDLSRWIKTNSNGIEESYKLENYYYYPSLNTKTLQLAFLRIHTSRITYMRTSYKLSEWEWEYYKIGDIPFEIEFSFLKTKTKIANVKIVFKNKKEEKGVLYYLFNGIEFKLVKTKFSNNLIEKDIQESIMSDEEKNNNFLSFLLSDIKFKTPKDEPKEIEKFLPKFHYRIGILEFNGHPILILSEK